jgi:hypothetical protein
MMATCPRCGGFLDEQHRCVGLWPRRARSLGGSAVAMLGGASVSLVALNMISSDLSGGTVALGVVAGMIIGQAMRTAVTRR